MVREESVQLIDDIDGSTAHETVTFGLDGMTYEIDLHSRRAAALRTSLSEFVAVARHTRPPRLRPQPATDRRQDRRRSGAHQQPTSAPGQPKSVSLPRDAGEYRPMSWSSTSQLGTSSSSADLADRPRDSTSPPPSGIAYRRLLWSVTFFSTSGLAPSLHGRSGPGWFFIIMAVVLFGVGLVAIFRPNTQMLGQRRGAFFRQANQWLYANEDGPERSRAGLLFVRGIGCFFLVVAVGMLVSGIRSV